MNIAYILPGIGVSGGISVICQHANRLLKRGHQVSLLVDYLQGNLDWFPNQNVPILPVNNTPKDLDILIATGWTTSFSLVDLPAKRKFYFVQSDETRFHKPDSVYQDITALSYLLDLQYFTEARWIRSWLKTNFGINAGLVPNGLDPELFFPDTPLEERSEKPRILLEGAIDLPYKGMKEAFEVVSNLDVEVWCVSSLGIPKPEWKCDRFFSQVPIDQMRNIYSSCDILLKLSSVEGFFGPPMEMMACGGTVVVGEVTGYDEYIVDGENALVVEQANIDQAREAVQRLINDPKLRNQLIGNGLMTAKEWSWEKSIDSLEDLLSRSLSVPQDARPTRALCDRAIANYYKLVQQGIINDDNRPGKLTNKVAILDIYKAHLSKYSWILDILIFMYNSAKTLRNWFKKSLTRPQ